MNIYLKFILAEIIAYLVFSFLNSVFFPENKNEKPVEGKNYFSKSHFKKEFFKVNMDNIKGFFERALLVLGMAYGFPHVIILFGALKIGTRLDNSKSCLATTNYFVLGNILSVILAILVVKL